MRTVDPESWSRKIPKHSLKVKRPLKFGKNDFSTFERCLRQSFNDAMKEFWTNCSVAAVKYVNKCFVSRFDKYHRLSLMLVIVSCGIFLVSFNCHRFLMTPPLMENLISDQHSISEIEFPAIALCSTNVINKTALDNYVRFLVSKDRNNTYTREDIERNMLTFGGLLTMALPATPIDVMFMQFLGDLLTNFNVTDVLYKLSPQCSSLLVRCSWAGRITPCEELFATRVTGLGFCCVFNSRYQPEDWRTPPKVLNVIGQDNGLSIVFKENSDEFAFVRSAMAGVQVLVFEGTEYPLLEVGAVRMYPLRQNTSVYLSLRASVQQPSDSLPYYNEFWRGCRMRWLAAGAARSWRSSYSWCLALCRARTAAALCACRPHTLPAAHHRVAVCSPNHLVCLNKYREKLVYYYPGEVQEPSLDEEVQNAQVCRHCAPDCARRGYSASLHYSRHELRLRRKTFQNFFLKGLPFANVTAIQIFYPIEDQRLYAVEGYFRWYEVVSKISGQWVCVVGVSAVSVAELVFHLACRWPAHFTRARARAAPRARARRN